MSGPSDWQSAEEDDSTPDVAVQIMALAMDPIGVLRRRWIWMLLVLVAALSATGAFVALMKPEFESTATVVITSQQIPEDFVRSTVRQDSFSNINAMVGEVLSNRNLSGLIERHDLYVDLRAERPLAGVIGKMRGSISIEPKRGQRSSGAGAGGSSVFVVKFVYIEPAATAKVTDELATMFINASLRRRNEQARLTTEFLRREQKRAEAELATANAKITEYKRQYRGELPSDMTTLLNRIERLNGLRDSVIAQSAAVDDRLSDFQKLQSEPSSPEAAILMLRLRLAEELSIHTDEHPNVISLRRRISLLEDEVSEVSRLSTKRGADVQDDIDEAIRDRSSLRLQLVEIEAEANEIDGRIDLIPERTTGLSALEQRAAVIREGYLEFMHKVQDAELAEQLESAQQGPRVSMLDRAQVPNAPRRPMIMYLGPGIALSIGLGIGVGIVLELFDPVVLSAAHLEAIGAPHLLGSIHRIA